MGAILLASCSQHPSDLRIKACPSSGRIWSEDELYRAAVRRHLEATNPTGNCISYGSVEEFLRLNPGCCSIDPKQSVRNRDPDSPPQYLGPIYRGMVSIRFRCGSQNKALGEFAIAFVDIDACGRTGFITQTPDTLRTK
jgi:hypothetical protein